MLPPMPSLDDYGVSLNNGFLPDELPLEVLPDRYYTKWEAIVANLQALLLTKRLKHVVEDLPIITTSRLRRPSEWRRAYVLLSFITHAYIWGGDRPEEACCAMPLNNRVLLIGIVENSTTNLHTIRPSMQAP